MAVGIAAFIAAFVVCATSSSAEHTSKKPGVIFTAPRSFAKGCDNEIQMTRYGIKEAGFVTISIQTSQPPYKVIASKVVTIKECERYRVIKFRVPENDEYQARMYVNGTFGEDEKAFDFELPEDIDLGGSCRRNLLIFTQTSRPIYEPGDTVDFRVLPLHPNLQTVGDNVTANISVQDPTGSRIEQWKNVDFRQGVRQFTLPLSVDPALGSWRIFVEMEGQQEAFYFPVQKYVLPKYEITIKPPPYVLVTDEKIEFEICAKYTYGKDVHGILRINASLEQYSWSHEKLPVLQNTTEIKGCYIYVLYVKYIDKQGYYYRRIQVVANVTENETGISRNHTVYVDRTQEPLMLQFVSSDYKQYCKPGLPYENRLKVTKPDKTPAPDEVIEICCTIRRERVVDNYWWGQRTVKYCRNYTSDSDGLILFKVPPQKRDAVSMQIEAKSMKYADSPPSEPNKPRLYQPQTSMSVKPYYSGNREFIQIQNPGGPLKCDEEQSIKILYTAEDGKCYNFHYEVVSKGKVLKRGHKNETFKMENDVTPDLCSDSLAVNDVRTVLLPILKDEPSEEEDVDCSSGPTGMMEIPIDTTDITFTAYFLVYLIGEDNEMIADSRKIEVEKCFPNKVEFKFRDKVKQPGDKTSFTIKASPDSVCGTKVVDKSVTLIDSNDQITQEKVYEALRNLDSEEYYTRNHCNDIYQRDGKTKQGQAMIIRPRPWSSSTYADSRTAFEDTGFMLLTTYKVPPGPCTKGGYDDYGIPMAATVGVRGGAQAPRPMMRPPPPPRRKVALRRPAAFADNGAAEKRGGVGGGAGTATKSVVDVRNYFPPSFLFDMKYVDDSGELTEKVTLPHTITEWRGNAFCVNKMDGFGVSEIASITTFQAFFISHDLPYSVTRGENSPIIVSFRNYLPEKCLPITWTVNVIEMTDDGRVTSETPYSEDTCVCPDDADVKKIMHRPETIGVTNVTVSAETAKDATICGDKDVADVVARDKATQSFLVEPPGFRQEKVTSVLICPADYEGSEYKKTFDIIFPDDAIEGSEKCFIQVTGNLLGSALDNVHQLVHMPTGCGEQNMLSFAPLMPVMEYLEISKQLTQSRNETLRSYMKTGYQGELKYKHTDGSYSAFGMSDPAGSTWLTAFVVKSYCWAKKWMDIDQKDTTEALEFLKRKQESNGCFREDGNVIHSEMKGGVNSHSRAALTAYVLHALYFCGVREKSVIDGGLACMKNDTNRKPYLNALFCNTAATVKSPDAEDYWDDLMEQRDEDGDQISWRNPNSSKSIDIETAGYALSCSLKRDKNQNEQETQIGTVRYLASQVNGNGGFSSTQDTVVGIESLCEFLKTKSKDNIDMKIKAIGEGLDKTYEFTEDNQLIFHKDRVFPGTVDVTATGKGCALFQIVKKYNVLTIPKKRVFSISVTYQCNPRAMKVCVSYLPDKQVSNMAVVEIKMISGFAADKEDLNGLVNDPKTGIKRCDEKNNFLNFYFQELTNEIRCFAFRMEEVFAVEDRQPATARVYDYYDDAKEGSTDYTISEC